MKGGEHLLHLAAPAGGALHHVVGAERRDKGRLHAIEIGGAVETNLEAIQPPEAAEGELRRSDVHQHDVAVHRPGRPAIGEQGANGELVDALAHAEAHRIAGSNPARRGELLGEHHRARIGQQTQELMVGLRRARSRRGEVVIAKRAIAQDVDAKDLQQLGAPARPRPRRLAFDDRRDVPDVLQPAQRGQTALVDAERRLGDLERGAAGGAVDCLLEAGERARRRQLNRENHGDAERDADDGGHRPHALHRDLAHDEGEKESPHHTAATMRPSFMCTTRCAAAATSLACVARRIDTPVSRLSSSSSARIVAPFAESRLPVGSSAMSSAGR
jgi:hypothetical protein